MANLPQGWKQGNKSNIYEANLKQVNVSTGSVSLVAETNKSNGDYTVYTTSGVNFIGGRTPLYTVSSSGARTIQNPEVYNQLQQSGEIAKLDSSIKPRAFEINQSLGTKEEKEAVQGSPLYKSQANTASSPNVGAGSSTPNSGFENQKELDEEAGKDKYREGTRYKSGDYRKDLKYPLDLKSELQDCIKFSIVKYSPSLAKENQKTGGTEFGSTKDRVVYLDKGIPIIKGSEILGTITLPIPAGISDGNNVSWQNSEINDLQLELGKIAQGFFDGGVEGATSKIEEGVAKVDNAGKTGDAQTAIKSLFLDTAVRGQVAQRAFGAVFNNNLELLFSGPSLRSFSFTFMLYPRSEKEAKEVRQIIRAFKQAMSVKRSVTSLLLKSPHTFAIQYVNGDRSHPYLNSFKECALTSCSVDYTPDGTYMTYGGVKDGVETEPSMTSYRLTLSFQELEPIFDDEYSKIDQNKDTYIGF